MYQVLFYSRSGNTKKIAEAIASEVGVKAEDVKAASIDPGASVVFLGSGCYGGKPGVDMAKFIEASDFDGRKVALFGTSADIMGNETIVMAEALKRKGVSVVGSYHCKGQHKAIFFLGRGHPNGEDLAGAKKIAREMMKNG